MTEHELNNWIEAINKYKSSLEPWDEVRFFAINEEDNLEELIWELVTIVNPNITELFWIPIHKKPKEIIPKKELWAVMKDDTIQQFKFN